MTAFTTNPEIEKLRQEFLDEFGTALNNLNDPNDKGVLNTQSTAKVFDWFIDKIYNRNI
jgi:Mg-chelatase subunit ChlI